uniref:Uncharacterized protein n=1 Tax=Steinernema glaseri TaxID=37863 RepID=A0A1I7YPU1_9BILA
MYRAFISTVLDENIHSIPRYPTRNQRGSESMKRECFDLSTEGTLVSEETCCKHAPDGKGANFIERKRDGENTNPE